MTDSTAPAPAPAGVEPQDAVADDRPSRFSATDLALIAIFGALVAVLSYVAAIPVGGAAVPITLQSLAIVTCGLVLGPVRGFLAVLLYLVLGAIGLPVFAEHSSGLGVFTGAGAGYLYSFPFVALIAGALTQHVVRERRTRALFLFAVALVVTVVNHLSGVAGMRVVLDVDWRTAFGYDAPFWVGDVAKGALAALIAAEVHRAFPQLLRRRG